MSNSELKPDILPQRLCSEIQLFDLCELDSCTSKNGRFCTETALLRRFEKIAENELRSPENLVFEEIDDEEAADSDGYDEDDECIADNLDADDGERWEEE